MLSKSVKQQIKDAINTRCIGLQQTLVPTQYHPIRNPWAHVCSYLKLALGKSYTECDDKDLQMILTLIQECN